MALSTRRMLLMIATVALGAALVLTATTLVASADSSPAEAAKKKRKKKMRVRTSCETDHRAFPPVDSDRDFLDYVFTVQRRTRSKQSRAAALVGLKGAKVTGKFSDLTPADGDNAVIKEASTRTNARGSAELEFEFNNFGDY